MQISFSLGGSVPTPAESTTSGQPDSHIISDANSLIWAAEGRPLRGLSATEHPSEIKTVRLAQDSDIYSSRLGTNTNRLPLALNIS